MSLDFDGIMIPMTNISLLLVKIVCLCCVSKEFHVMTVISLFLWIDVSNLDVFISFDQSSKFQVPLLSYYLYINDYHYYLMVINC